MVTEEKVGIHEAEDARLVTELNCPKWVLCAAPVENGLLFTGGEDKNITAWDTSSGNVAYYIEGAHSSCVKGITKNYVAPADDPYFLVSASL